MSEQEQRRIEQAAARTGLEATEVRRGLFQGKLALTGGIVLSALLVLGGARALGVNTREHRTGLGAATAAVFLALLWVSNRFSGRNDLARSPEAEIAERVDLDRRQLPPSPGKARLKAARLKAARVEPTAIGGDWRVYAIPDLGEVRYRKGAYVLREPSGAEQRFADVAALAKHLEGGA